VVDVAGHLTADVGPAGYGELIAEPRTCLGRDVTQPSDYSEQVIVLGRLKPGMTSESRRVVHVFQLVTDLLHDAVVSARCGVALVAGDLQWLPRFAGMPCERCVMTGQPQPMLGTNAGGW
jgi:hypothetical protein